MGTFSQAASRLIKPELYSHMHAHSAWSAYTHSILAHSYTNTLAGWENVSIYVYMQVSDVAYLHK